MNHSPALFDPSPMEPHSGMAERVLDNFARTGISPGPGERGQDPLRAALLQSRQRWRDMALMAGDLAFETDRAGRFVFLSPDPAFGWPVVTLLGQDAETLLAGSSFAQNYNPFRPVTPVRARRAWLRRPDGGSVCFSFACAPLLDEEGRIIGARGLGQDVSAQDGHDAAVATALRRGQMLDHILWRMRQEVLAPRMMQAALDSIITAIGMAQELEIMIAAVVIAVGVMYISAGPVAACGRASDHEDAGPCVPRTDRRRIGGGRIPVPHSAFVYLCRDLLLGRCRGLQHSCAAQPQKTFQNIVNALTCARSTMRLDISARLDNFARYSTGSGS